MLKFISLAVKIQLNVHDLNNEGVAGNVMDIRVMEYLDESGKRQEAPAVSGRMLKHWHYEGMRHLILRGEYTAMPLCDGCRAGEPLRPGKIETGEIKQIATDDNEAINSCALCDVHGYLIAQEAKKLNSKGQSERGFSSRRSSRVMFSWLMPVIGTENTSRQVIHTRVSQQKSVSGGEDKAQMIFSKSYASGIYAFVSALDIARIGIVELGLGAKESSEGIGAEERKKRIKAAIQAYRFLVSGMMGASLSHALPHINPVEMMVAYSETGPLPFPISPMYSDYFEKTLGIMPGDAQIISWGREKPQNLSEDKKDKEGCRQPQVVSTIDELFKILLSKV